MRQLFSIFPTQWQRLCLVHLPSRRFYTSDVFRSRLETPVQQYVSSSTDPYLNLSIEHHLLQQSSVDSVILFLYVNHPSVVIGRNQNPWYEVNLPLLSARSSGTGEIDLVRRRSGGGTVFHDHGNVNWTVICPPKAFTRDKHAEMIVHALRDCGYTRARVNERHDIVMDQGSKCTAGDSNDLHGTAYRENGNVRSLKVSGSAYKLTKNRALHHGTCLLSSPNLANIGRFLRSLLKPYITAKGVESVSSPITNIGLSNEDFMGAVQAQFNALYPSHTDMITLDQACAELAPILDGISELKVSPVEQPCHTLLTIRSMQSPQWLYLQTPQFNLSTPPDIHNARLVVTVRYGIITAAQVKIGDQAVWHSSEGLNGQTFHAINNWQQLFNEAKWKSADPVSKHPAFDKFGAWLEQHLSSA